MDELEDKIGAVLGNPQLMQQIMSMAQALGQSSPEPPPPPLVVCCVGLGVGVAGLGVGVAGLGVGEGVLIGSACVYWAYT